MNTAQCKSTTKRGTVWASATGNARALATRHRSCSNNQSTWMAAYSMLGQPRPNWQLSTRSSVF